MFLLDGKMKDQFGAVVFDLLIVLPYASTLGRGIVRRKFHATFFRLNGFSTLVLHPEEKRK
jgi:hypothetical protein